MIRHRSSQPPDRVLRESLRELGLSFLPNGTAEFTGITAAFAVNLMQYALTLRYAIAPCAGLLLTPPETAD